jgi:chaperonin GroES
MTKTLLIPDYIVEQQRAKKEAEEKAKQKPLSERVPQPTGWRILVMPYTGKEKTDSGIYIPDNARDREARATVVCYVVKVGPLAYKDPDKFGPESQPWCKEGDWVCIGRYAGSRFNIEGGEVRIINDDEVIATIVDPDDIKTYGV